MLQVSAANVGASPSPISVLYCSPVSGNSIPSLLRLLPVALRALTYLVQVISELILYPK